MSHFLKIELGLLALNLVFVVFLLLGFDLFSMPFLATMIALGCFWLSSSFSQKLFGNTPWFGIIFSLPILIIPMGIGLKISITAGGAFVLFIGLVLSVLSISALFILILNSKTYLTYLKNVSIRLIPITTMGIVVYFTPQLNLAEMVYSGNEEKLKEFRTQLEFVSEAKPQVETIIFVSNRNGKSDIFEINEDASNLKEIIALEGNQWAPRAHPNGEDIYFLSDHDSVFGLYSFNYPTKNIELRGEIVFDDFYYQFAPDGNSIVYHDTINGKYQLFQLTLQSEEINQLTIDSCNNSKPYYFPNGEKIVYQSDCNGQSNLLMYDVSSGEIGRILQMDDNQRNPTVSPYSDVVIFNSDEDSMTNIDLYYYDFNSNEKGRLSNSQGLVLFGQFSSNAKKIVFGNNIDGNWELYTMKNNGELKERLTNNIAFDGDAIWFKKSFIKPKGH